MNQAEREFDVIVWGATGFTGGLTAEYLLERYGLVGNLRWAIAGRSQSKLNDTLKHLEDSTGISAQALPTILANADDANSMRALAERATVICSTVGPYALYGNHLVAACAASGTHYCDLTGEAHWMRRMIDAHEETAKKSGARIVFTCGFDCVPSDLGTFFMQNEMKVRHGVPASEVKFRVKGFKGAASGGTIASMINMMDEASKDPDVMRVMNQPYSLNPAEDQQGPDQPEPRLPAYDSDFEAWTSPFVMGAINTKVVRRTNSLLNHAYGQNFRYSEAMLSGSGATGFAKATAVAGSSVAMMGAMAIGPMRRLIAPRLPAPGEGPNEEARLAGYFDIRFLARHPHDATKNLRGKVTGDRDPGYGSTSKMLAESAVCLAHDDLTSASGILTPAAALGEAYLLRLQKSAGLDFSIESTSPGIGA